MDRSVLRACGRRRAKSPGQVHARRPIARRRYGPRPRDPDGQTIAFTQQSSGGEAVESPGSGDLDRRPRRRGTLTSSTPWRRGLNASPASFSPDGSVLALLAATARAGLTDCDRRKPTDSAGRDACSSRRRFGIRLSPRTERRVAFCGDRASFRDIATAGRSLSRSLRGAAEWRRAPQRLTSTPSDGSGVPSPSWDPSGSRLALHPTMNLARRTAASSESASCDRPDQRRRHLPDRDALRPRSAYFGPPGSPAPAARPAPIELLSAAATAARGGGAASTLAWRSVLTSIRPVPAARASGRSARDSRRRWGRSKRAAAFATSTPRGVPSRASNSSLAQRLLLGQEVEDAAAVVVDDDDADRGRDVAQGGEAAEVVEQAEVAGDDRGRAAAGVGGADPGGDEAVDAVGAAVAEEEGVGVAGGEEGLLVADRHARGGVDEVAVARGRRRGRGAGAGSVSSSRRRRARPPSAAARRGLGLEPGLGARRAAPSPAAPPSPAASSVGSARRIAAARWLGSFQPP